MQLIFVNHAELEDINLNLENHFALIAQHLHILLRARVFAILVLIIIIRIWVLQHVLQKKVIKLFHFVSSTNKNTDCTIDDVQYLYTDCTLVNGQLSQVSYPVWNDPHICNDHGNSVPPYPNSTSDCGFTLSY